MISRRDALRLAAALTATTPLAPFATTPERAAALLAEPVEFDGAPSGRPLHQVEELDPVSFAEGISGVDWMQDFVYGAAPEMAAYKQRFNALLDALGERTADLPGDHPLMELDEAALSMWCAAWAAGIRVGAASEHLRLALVTPRQECRACHGNGVTWAGKPYRHYNTGDNAAVCTVCAGLGHVATPPATLDLAGMGGSQ